MQRDTAPVRPGEELNIEALRQYLTGRLEGFIDCTEREPKFAVGGQVLTVWSASDRTFKLYDLATRQQIASKTMPGSGTASRSCS